MPPLLEMVLEWLSENKEWVFSGIGVVIIFTMISFFRKNLRKFIVDLFTRKNKAKIEEKGSAEITDSEVDGVVAGRDINLGNNHNEEENDRR